MSWIAQTHGGVIVNIHAAPRASRNHVQGLHGDALKIRLQAPPVDGKANETLLRFIAELLDIPARNVALLSGETSRHKRILARGVTIETAQRHLLSRAG